MNIRFRVHNWSRDPRSDYLRACGEAIERQQQYRRAQLPDDPQRKLLPLGRGPLAAA